MTKLNINYRLYIGVALAFLVSAVIGITSWLSFKRQDQMSGSVRHSYKVMNTAGNIQKLMIDMETGRRGFRVTNEKRFLQPYYEGKKRIGPSVTELQKLVADNTIQENKAKILEQNINNLLLFWESKGDDAGKYTREVITGITDDEKRQMDEIRGNVNELLQAENTLLAEREKENNASMNFTSWTSVLGIIFIQAIIAILIILVVKEFKRNSIAKGKLKLSNEDLATQKAELQASGKELQNALNKVEEINKQLEKFVYTVAHDIKSPLAGISGVLSLLDKNDIVVANPELSEYLNLSSSAALYLCKMVNSLLEYSRISFHQQKKELVNTRELVEQIAVLMFPPKNIHIQIAEIMPVFETKKIKIEQVFQNLISNAIKYNDKEEGYIEIGYEEKKDHYEFFVKDNGQGISEEDRHKVFQLFNTGKNKSAREPSTGFGLNIVKLIVEEQGGKVWVNSYPEDGSVFFFEWKK